MTFSPEIITLDLNFQNCKNAIASYLIPYPDGIILIESGPGSTQMQLQKNLNNFGYDLQEITHILLTHIHLDHAGGSGQLMEQLPEAELVVHPYGARHMIDPTKVQAGTIAVYGEEAFKRDYLELVPIPEQRVLEAEDGFTVELEGRKLLCLDTPGHARHHITIWDEQSRGFFSGDTLGMSYRELDTENGPFMILPSTPVQFDPDTWHQTLDRLMTYQPRHIYLTHYCRVSNPEPLVEALHQALDAYVEIALASDPENRLQSLKQGLRDYYLKGLRQHGSNLSEEEIDAVLDMDMGLCAQGLEIWLKRREKE